MGNRVGSASVALAAILVAGWIGGPRAAAQQPMPSVIGLRIGVSSYTFRNFTFYEAVDKASVIGIRAIEGYAGHKTSEGIPKGLHWDLTESEIRAVSQKLGSRGVAMPTYYAGRLQGLDAESAAKLAQFVRLLGIQTIIAEPSPDSLAELDRVANQYNFNIAIHNHTRRGSPVYWDPKNVMQVLEGRSKRMGVAPDIGAWMREGIKPIDGLRIVKDRLLSLHMRDRAMGPEGPDLPLGDGEGDLVEFVRELYTLGLKPASLSIEYSPNRENPSPDVARSAHFLEQTAIRPIVAEVMDEISRKTPHRRDLTPEDRERVVAALPREAPAKPKKPRRLLIVDLQAAYYGHPSIPHANLAVELMGKNTGAFEPVFSNDLANLRWDKLRHFDALFLNNTVGPIFNADDLRRDLLRYVREGGGLAGYHGTSRASRDWPEFGEMLGAHSGPHGDQNEKVTVKIDDPGNPINAAFGGKPFDFTDEYFRFPTPPYSREKLRILLSFDVEQTDMNQGRICSNCAREDNDYAISWIRNYGKGRVFFSNFGNSPHVLWTPEILQHFLAGIQFALGDLEADATPSAEMAGRAAGR